MFASGIGSSQCHILPLRVRNYSSVLFTAPQGKHKAVVGRGGGFAQEPGPGDPSITKMLT